MLKLLRNADIYAPEHRGLSDILICNGKIERIGEGLEAYAELPEVEVINLAGAITVPGYIDLHVHITGGGGEQGPASRVPEIKLTELTRCGVTTALGLLGTDGITRSQENLLAKCRALNEEGITCFMLTGSYQYPTQTLIGDVIRDISIIDRCVGVKVALADHRGSNMTEQELIRLASDARLGGLISGKAGLVVMHMGDGDLRMSSIFDAIEHSNIPISTFLPTHCCRNEQLTMDAVKLTKMGGNADFTANDDGTHGGTARIIANAVKKNGGDINHMSLSSDACGSQPRFNEKRECIGLTYTSPSILHDELLRLVQNEGMELSMALLLLTRNPARILALGGIKGEIRENADADILVYDENMKINHVFARGKTAVFNKTPILKGRFEE